MNLHFFDMKAAHAFVAEKPDDKRDRRNRVSRYRCDRHALDGHSAHEYEKQIENDVRYPRNSKHDKRRARISLGVKHGYGEVCKRNDRQSDEINLRIRSRKRKKFSAVAHRR